MDKDDEVYPPSRRGSGTNSSFLQKAPSWALGRVGQTDVSEDISAQLSTQKTPVLVCFRASEVRGRSLRLGGIAPAPSNTATMPARLVLVPTLALTLIFLAILLTANEIRFQGCVDARVQQIAINADHPRQNVIPGAQECSRVPFGA